MSHAMNIFRAVVPVGLFGVLVGTLAACSGVKLPVDCSHRGPDDDTPNKHEFVCPAISSQEFEVLNFRGEPGPWKLTELSGREGKIVNPQGVEYGGEFDEPDSHSHSGKHKSGHGSGHGSGHNSGHGTGHDKVKSHPTHRQPAQPAQPTKQPSHRR
jgi:hypothetical protein